MKNFPFIRHIEQLPFTAEYGYSESSFNIPNEGKECNFTCSISGREFVIFGIDAKFDGNINNVFNFLSWITRRPSRKLFSYVELFAEYEGKMVHDWIYASGDMIHLFDFVTNCQSEEKVFSKVRGYALKSNKEIYNSESRNPIRVEFNDFVKCMAFMSNTDIQDVLYFLFKKMDLIEVYLRGGDATKKRLETPDETPILLRSADALKKYEGNIGNIKGRVPEQFSSKIYAQHRSVNFEYLLDDNLYNLYYTILDIDEPDKKMKPLKLSAFGFKPSTENGASYFEFDLLEKISDENVFIFHVSTFTHRAIPHVLRALVTDAKEDEIEAVLSEIDTIY